MLVSKRCLLLWWWMLAGVETAVAGPQMTGDYLLYARLAKALAEKKEGNEFNKKPVGGNPVGKSVSENKGIPTESTPLTSKSVVKN